MLGPITVDRAIWTGLAVVNGPVALLLGGPGYAVFRLVGNGPLVAFAMIAGFALAWLWWSLSVPRWRLWAYERVTDIPRLKARAIEAGLTWPDGSVFGRTEIKSADAQGQLLKRIPEK
jgi:hypothetical protein